MSYSCDWCTVDVGEIRWRIPKGKTEGAPYWVCGECHKLYFQEDLTKEEIVRRQTRSGSGVEPADRSDDRTI